MSTRITVKVNGNVWADREIPEEEVQLYKSLGIDLTRTAPEPVGKHSVLSTGPRGESVWAKPIEEHLKASAKALNDQVQKQEKDAKGRTPSQVQRDREREAVTRAVHVVERQIRRMPASASGIAGYLQALGYSGDKTSTGNALAKYLKDKITESGCWEDPAFGKDTSVAVYADANAIIVETPIFQMCIDIPFHVRFVISGIQNERWPAIVTGV